MTIESLNSKICINKLYYHLKERREEIALESLQLNTLLNLKIGSKIINFFTFIFKYKRI